MRATLLVLLAACGQMYQKPGGGQTSDPAARPVEGSPGGGTAADPWNDPPPSGPPAAPAPPTTAPAMPARADDASPPPAEPVEAAAGKGGGSVADQWIAAHNQARAKHCAPPLTWSKKLADVAQKWANTLKAKGCVFGHSGDTKYGENLAAGTQGALDPTSTVEMWYEESKGYKFPNGGFSMKTGHFTQLVWRSTKQVGCGHVTCKGNDIYVCNYDPPGNWDGQYKQEVLPASCRRSSRRSG